MPFTGSVYVNVTGATTAVAGQVVQSAVWNNIHNDMGTALTETMSQLVSTNTNRNLLWMNGGLEVWQKGAGSSASISVTASTTVYTADRWYIIAGANQGSVVAAVAGLSNNSNLAAKIGRSVGQTGLTQMYFAYPIDIDEIYRMRGNKVDFTALVQTGLNWSPASGTLVINLYVGTGAVGKRGATPFTGETQILNISTNITPGSVAQSISASSTAVIPTTTTQAELQFTWTPVGTAGAADNFTIDDVQLEAQTSSTTWTPTNYDRLDFPSMLRGCKRYYTKTFPYSTAPAVNAGMSGALMAIAIATQRFFINWELPVELRATGTQTTYIPLTGTSANFYDVTASVSVAATIDANNASPKLMTIYSTASGSVTNDLIYIHADISAGL